MTVPNHPGSSFAGQRPGLRFVFLLRAYPDFEFRLAAVGEIGEPRFIILDVLKLFVDYLRLH
jgi:hypothetical protein